MTPLSIFGATAAGADVRSCRLERGDLVVEVIEYGAAVRSLRVGGIETVLGFSTLAEYEADRSYQGVVVGRVANRIGGSRFTLDGNDFEVTANEGSNCLHGGQRGLHKQVWCFSEVGDAMASLTYISPAGEEGFPGTVEAKVTFQLGDDALEIVWEATTDAPTPINLTQHLYFNLDGDPAWDVLDHRLSIRAEATTPVHGDLIPTGAIEAVAGTPFDLRTPRQLNETAFADDPQIDIGGGYDHNWVLANGPGPALTLQSPRTGLRLEIETDQPGVQVYSGQGLKSPTAQ